VREGWNRMRTSNKAGWNGMRQEYGGKDGMTLDRSSEGRVE
jgi:hypothetical protein